MVVSVKNIVYTSKMVYEVIKSHILNTLEFLTQQAIVA